MMGGVRLILKGLLIGLPIATSFLWARSAFFADSIMWLREHGMTRLRSARGQVDFDHRRWLYLKTEPRLEYQTERLESPFVPRKTRFGFGYVAGGSRDARGAVFSIRYWVLLLAASVVPSLWLWSWVIRRRSRRTPAGRFC